MGPREKNSAMSETRPGARTPRVTEAHRMRARRWLGLGPSQPRESSRVRNEIAQCALLVATIEAETSNASERPSPPPADEIIEIDEEGKVVRGQHLVDALRRKAAMPCYHAQLTLLEGPIHANDNPPIYVCKLCGEQLRVTLSPATIGVSYGKPK